jgi:hypothetical protein
MAKQKATHRGECQICGRFQKLPNGRLSTHGYTVQWNMFQGTCPGSGELPYEQSCDLIKARLPWVKERVTEMNKYRKALLQPATEPKAYVRVWLRSVSSYTWLELRLTEVYHKNEQSGHEWRTIMAKYKDESEEKAQNVGSPYYEEPLLDCATRLNEEYVERHYSKTIQETEAYLKWCEDRIANWEAKPLQAI